MLLLHSVPDDGFGEAQKSTVRTMKEESTTKFRAVLLMMMTTRKSFQGGFLFFIHGLLFPFLFLRHFLIKLLTDIITLNEVGRRSVNLFILRHRTLQNHRNWQRHRSANARETKVGRHGDWNGGAALAINSCKFNYLFRCWCFAKENSGSSNCGCQEALENIWENNEWGWWSVEL